MVLVDSHSSLSYQITLYLNTWYLAAFVVCEFLLLIFKTSILPFPPGNIVAEVFLVLFFISTESVRIYMGKKGNLVEQIMPLALSIIFTAPSVLAVLYLLLWQTYVLRIEVILVSIQLVFQAIGLMFAFLGIVTISKSGSY